MRKSGVKYADIQPESSDDQNCVALTTEAYFETFSWITIRCDEIYEATYICKPNQTQREVRGTILMDRTCDKNWLTFQGSETCFYVMSKEIELSFHGNQNICSSHNASIFKVTTSPPAFSAEINQRIKKYLATGLLYISKTTYPHVLSPDMPIRDWQYFLFGENLSTSSLNNLLLSVLSWAIDRPQQMKFFANLNNLCVILEFSRIHYYYYEDKSQVTRGWGVSCVPCSRLINVSGIICEKPSRRNIIQCQNNHFKCHDKTCILLIYKCDSVVDCFDGSDENNCFSDNTSLHLIDQFVNMPCSTIRQCSTTMTCKVYVHELCDGLDSSLIVKENMVCVSQNVHILKPIIKNRIWRATKDVIFNSTDLAGLFIRRVKEAYTCSTSTNNGDNATNSINTRTSLQINYEASDYCSNINTICEVNLDDTRCYSNHARLICGPLACPGMFKCHTSYCIPLSSMCDKKYDCKRGEDEQSCSKLKCPGFLKCRGEERCVGIKEICDLHVHCRYSMDDELNCDICLDGCSCNGYVISCFLNNSIENTYSQKVLYVKGLVVKGTQSVIYLNKLNFSSLLFLNISYCELSHLVVSDIKTTTVIRILIADFSHNYIRSIYFLQFSIFQNIMCIDLSFNLLSAIRYAAGLMSTYLSVLYLRGNSLKEIDLGLIYPSKLVLLDLQNISYYYGLSILIDPSMSQKLIIKVSDHLLCCNIPTDIDCVTTETHIQCNGLLETYPAKISFYCLSLLCVSMTTIVFIKQSFRMYSGTHLGQNSPHLLIMMSQSVSSMSSALYMTTISITDAIDVNYLIFTQGILCVFLHAILFISLETTIVFKTWLVGFVSLKIIYPFKHQCTWLKWTPTATGSIWIVIIVAYVTYIAIRLGEQTQPVYDRLCSIGWCGITVSLNILHCIIYIVDNACICTHIIVALKVYTSLKKIQQNNNLVSNKPYSVGVITCKLVIPNFTEVLFRLYLATSLTFNLMGLKNKYYCLYLFTYAWPVNMCCFSMFYLFR